MGNLSIESIRSLDKSNMLNLLLDFPQQLLDAAKIGNSTTFLKDSMKGFNDIVFSGVGGSAIGADLIRSYLGEECKVPIIVNRDYSLPTFVDNDTLLIISSYSGNTEETLSAYGEGVRRGSRIVAITSNGELKRLAEKDGFLCITVPQGLPPRCALGYSSIPIIILFSKLGLISNKSNEIEETARVLNRLNKTTLSPQVGEDRNIAKKIASLLFDKYAVIYGANRHTDVVATRWRGQLAENAKTISSSHLFPEMNHNEIVGWRNPRDLMEDLVAIILKDSGDHPRTKKRMEITKLLIEKEGVKVIEVCSQEKRLLARIFSLIYIGDFVSFYLAILNNVDPTPVDVVQYLKKELAKL